MLLVAAAAAEEEEEDEARLGEMDGSLRLRHAVATVVTVPADAHGADCCISRPRQREGPTPFAAKWKSVV